MARRAILYIAMSVDGYIADEQGKVDWLVGNNEMDESDGNYEQFSEMVDTVVMGRVTYDQILNELSPGKWPYEELNTYVVSKHPPCNRCAEHCTNMDVCELVADLKQQSGKDIWILGGAQIVDALIKADLIDEYQISIVPIILGKGIKLFNENNPTTSLHLDCCTINNGIVMTVYRKKRR